MLSAALLTVASFPKKEQNEAVRKRVLTMVLAAVAGGCSLQAIPQYHDRDSRGASKTSASAPSPELRVDINVASFEELLKVPGMTPVWAARILRYRPYRTKLDLEENGIVTEAVYERIKDSVIAHRIKK